MAAKDLKVAAGTDVVLGDEAPPELAHAFTRATVRTYGDLVEHGLVGSEDELKTLVSAARTVTDRAINDPASFRRRQPLGRRDLGRFPAMLAATADVEPVTMRGFWRLARAEDPRVVARWDLKRVKQLEITRIFDITKWVFKDVTVESGATLKLTSMDSHLWCGHLLIKPGGRIVATGKTSFITATTIKGE